MVMQQTAMVMDISPWPSGNGFHGAQDWWNYVLSKDEKKRLDNMLGAALLSDAVQHRLVEERDETLMDAFGLSESTKQWLCEIEAGSLTEIASAVVKAYRGL